MLESVEIETTHFSQIFHFYTPENVRKAKVFKGDLKQALNFFNSTVFYNYNFFFFVGLPAIFVGVFMKLRLDDYGSDSM